MVDKEIIEAAMRLGGCSDSVVGFVMNVVDGVIEDPPGALDTPLDVLYEVRVSRSRLEPPAASSRRVGVCRVGYLGHRSMTPTIGSVISGLPTGLLSFEYVDDPATANVVLQDVHSSRRVSPCRPGQCVVRLGLLGLQGDGLRGEVTRALVDALLFRLQRAA